MFDLCGRGWFKKRRYTHKRFKLVKEIGKYDVGSILKNAPELTDIEDRLINDL